MAVDFTEAQIGVQSTGPLSGGGQRPAPVQSPSAAGAALNLFAQVMPTAQQLQQRRQAEQERVKAGFVEQFSQQQLSLAEAVDMGEISSQEARMRMRANYAQAISNNPLLIDELSSAQQQIIGTSGLGKVAAEGTEEEQRHFRTLQAMSDDGWINNSMSIEEQESLVGAYQDFQLAGAMLERAQQELTYERGQVGLQSDRLGVRQAEVSLARGHLGLESDRIGLQRLQASVQAENAVGQMAASYFQKFNTDIRNITERVESGELDEVSAQLELDQQFAVIQNVVRGVGAEARTDWLNNMTTGFEDLYNSATRYISGDLTLSALENRTNTALAIQSANITGDPDTAALISSLNIVRHPLTGFVTEEPVTRRLLDYLEDNNAEAGPPANLLSPAQRGEARSYINILKPNLRSAARGTLEEDVGRGSEEEVVEEVSRNFNNVLRGISAYQMAVEEASDYNDMVDFLSGEEVREAVTSGKLTIDSNNAREASEVIQSQYQEVVLPLIREEWQRANVQVRSERFGPGPGGVDAGREPVSEHIRPEFSGGMFRFTTSSEAPAVRQRVRELNREAAAAVNRLIRTGAHLELHDDYETIYRNLEPRLFGESAEE